MFVRSNKQLLSDTLMDVKTLFSWFRGPSADRSATTAEKEQLSNSEPNNAQALVSNEAALYQKLQQELMGQLSALHNSAIVSETDLEGNITFANETFCRVAKYSLDELLGQNHRILKSGHQPDEIFVELWKTISKGKMWKGIVKNKAKDGSYYWVAATITPILDITTGKPVKYVSVRYDITEQKQQEEELKQAYEELQMHEEELQQTLEEIAATAEELNKTQLELRGQITALNNAAIVSETDLQGTITYVNDTFCATSKYHRLELLGQNHRMLKSGHQADELFQNLWKTISRGEYWRGEVKNRAKDGSYYWVAATITPVLGPEGKPVKYIGVRFDITEQKALQAQLENAREALESQVEEKKHELQDSVDYAQRIQEAMIPDQATVNLNLPAGWKAGVFFRPKDKVSGDFVWLGKWKNKLLLSLGDGSGHGVPGAFMSIIGLTTLTKLVEDRGMIEPASLLDELDAEVRRTLHQDQTGSTQDSIEMSIIALTEGRNTVTVGSAMRSAILVRNGELIEKTATRRPIGGTLHGNTAFTSEHFEVLPGDTLYLMSDGFSDQHGGNEHPPRKLGRAAVRELLAAIARHPAEEHPGLLAKALEDWKGPILPQTDDIAILSLQYVG